MNYALCIEKMINHIAIIMDGNGRWAEARGKSRSSGHRVGVRVLEDIADYCFGNSISTLTVYAFSSENKARPKKEVDGLVKLIKEFFVKRLPKFIKNETRVVVIGDKTFFSSDVQAIINNAEEKTAHFKNKTLCIALNYGARDEIVRAVNKAVAAGSVVNENSFAQFLDTAALPAIDIIVRTGGEVRLSNFLLYQAAYSELFFVDDLWPDFNTEKLATIIEQFRLRNRRFGK